MVEAVKNTPYGVVAIRLEFSAEMADKPAILGEALEHNLFRIREHNQRVDSIRSVDVMFPLDRKNLVIADMSLNTTVVVGSVEQDYTALKQELASRISEALKTKRETNATSD